MSTLTNLVCRLEFIETLRPITYSKTRLLNEETGAGKPTPVSVSNLVADRELDS